LCELRRIARKSQADAAAEAGVMQSKLRAQPRPVVLPRGGLAPGGCQQSSRAVEVTGSTQTLIWSPSETSRSASSTFVADVGAASVGRSDVRDDS
jgi:hypothetical protein